MTMHRRMVLAGAVVGLFAVARQARAASHSVTMNPSTSKFEPATLTIKRNDTVEWENTTGVFHSVTCDPSLSKVPGNVVLPAGVAPFDSGRMKREAVFTHQFTEPGTYKYICKYHENMNMVGTVIVK